MPKRQRRDKIVPKVSPGKQKNAQFFPVKFHFFEQDRLLFARDEINVTEFPTKTAKEEEEEDEIVSEIYFKSGCASAASKMSFFCGKDLLRERGYNFKTG